MTLILKLVAIVTLVSGLLQMVLPSFVLGFVGGETTPTSAHFFGIIGMFMVLFGGLLLQALLGAKPNVLAVFWCGLQKVGAAAAVGLGIAKGLFSMLAIGVAGFDLLSAVLILVFWNRIRQQ